MINVDLRSRTPIYEQLYENIRRLILEGALEADEKMPSVRELASSLTINPNTIQKAYRQLEQEGYIYVTRGRGNFVRQLEEDLIDQQGEVIHKALCHLAQDAIILGFSQERFLEMAKLCYEEVADD